MATKKKAVKKKTAKKKAVKKKAIKKKTAKKKAVKKPSLSAKQRDEIHKALKSAEERLLENYRKVAGMSAKDWERESEKYRKVVVRDVGKAKKQIEAEVRKNPQAAKAAATAVAAVVGAFVLSRIKK
jgi:flagellar biosynthesis protein FliP